MAKKNLSHLPIFFWHYLVASKYKRKNDIISELYVINLDVPHTPHNVLKNEWTNHEYRVKTQVQNIKYTYTVYGPISHVVLENDKNTSSWNSKEKYVLPFLF